MAQSNLLFQDMTFTVLDHAEKGVEVAFEGRYDGEETSGSKWYLDEAAVQVKVIAVGLSSVHPHKGVLLSRLTGVESHWQILDRAETRWSREAPGFVVVVTREVGTNATDPDARYWLQTLDGDDEIGPYATHEVFDAAGARRVASELCREPELAPSV